MGYDEPALPAYAEIMHPPATRAVGRMGSSLYNVGLALLRLDKVGCDELEVVEGKAVKGFVPDWWPVHDTTT